MELAYIVAALISGVIFGLILDRRYSAVVSLMLRLVAYAIVFLVGVSGSSALGSMTLSRSIWVIYTSAAISILAGFSSVAVSMILLRVTGLESRARAGGDGLDPHKSIGVTGPSIRDPVVFALAIVLGFIFGYLLDAAGYIGGEALSLAIDMVLLLLIFLAGASLPVECGVAGLLARFSGVIVVLSIGSLLGSLLAGVIFALYTGLPYIVPATLGLGWYSFAASYLLASYGYEASIYGLFINYFREASSFVAVPLIYRLLRGRSLSIVSYGGATTMDNTLPIYISILGSRSSIAAVGHGIILTIATPFAMSISVSIYMG